MNHAGSRPARGMKLTHRRLLRVYFYPRIQLLVTGALCLLSIRSGVDSRVAIVWLFITFVCFVVEDLYASESLIVWAANWVGRRWMAPRDDLNTADEVYSIYPPPLGYKYRNILRWLASLTLVLATWAFAVIVSRPADLSLVATRGLLTMLLLIFALVPYGLTLFSPTVSGNGWGYRFSWFVVLIAVPVVAILAVGNLIESRSYGILAALIITLIYFTVFAAQRVWATERVWNEILREMNKLLQSWPRPGDGYEEVPRLIAERMPYPRIYLLWPTADGQSLAIREGYPDIAGLRGQTVPIDNSLTGMAFRRRRSIARNDVNHFDDHKALTLTDTRAEIAVPVMHGEAIYAVLDVQDTSKNVFTPGDTEALELVGRMLGSAVAADKQNQVYDRAVRLTDIANIATSEDVANEQAVFHLFAEAAQDILGADLITYYPLTLAGRPILQPYGHGDFRRRDLLRSPLDDTTGILIPLITDWKHVFAPRVRDDERLVGQQPAGGLRFIDREEVGSACFIPIGARRERLGVLFLNYHQPRAFDAMFKFTALAFGQWLATIMAQSRYRDAARRGFSRPALNLHTLVGRYGFSFHNSARIQAHDLLRQGHGDHHKPDGCPLLHLVDNIDGMLRELSLDEAAAAVDFWEKDLRDQIDDYVSSLKPVGNRKPFIRRAIPRVIEYENPLLKTALFRIITEAIGNALKYAQADRVNVVVQRWALNIDVCIENNGKPLPEDARKNRSSYGIFHLLDLAKDELGASDDVKRLDAGARITLSIPALPIAAFYETPSVPFDGPIDAEESA